MSEPGTDAAASLLGKWGLSNHLIAWLIGRGHGEIVALRSEEFERPMVPPKCPGRHEKPVPTMLYRPGYWACYQHATPVKLRHSFVEPAIPDFPGTIEDALDQVVDLRYEYNPLLGRGQWNYKTRKLDAS